MSTSDTPRTEKHRNCSNPDMPEEVVAWNFARQLERELSAAQARIAASTKTPKRLTFDERDHYGKILWDAYCLNCDTIGNMGQWETLGNGTQGEFRNMAEAVVQAAMQPPPNTLPHA